MSRFICYFAEYHYADCRYADCHYAECHYAGCPYAECRGAKIPAWLYSILGLQVFHSSYKILFVVHFNHSRFWSSAHVNPTVNDLVHT